MRTLCAFSAVLLLAGLPACVDAPITQNHLEADGTLRASNLGQASHMARARLEPRQAVQIAAVLAAQAEGALEDATSFAADVGTIHLHLRADSLQQPRHVLYRWTHGDLAVEVPGVLAPTTTLSLAETFPVDPDQVGMWQVEVVSLTPEGEPDSILFRREFEVRPLSPL